jgi:hypothetical protein
MTASDGAADLQRWRIPPVYRMLSGGMLLAGRHQNKVWRGLGQLPNNTEPGVTFCIKWIKKKEALATELACSLAAQALKLPVPRGALVIADYEQLPGLPASVKGAATDKVLCFGSEYQWPDDTVARPKGLEAEEEWVWRQLCQTP